MIKTTFRTEGAVSAKAVQPDRARHRKTTSVAETLRRMGNSGCVCVGGVGVGVGVCVVGVCVCVCVVGVCVWVCVCATGKGKAARED